MCHASSVHLGHLSLSPIITLITNYAQALSDPQDHIKPPSKKVKNTNMEFYNKVIEFDKQIVYIGVIDATEPKSYFCIRPTPSLPLGYFC